MFQYKMSTMLLEKHRRGLSMQRTKHIHVRYFLIKDCIGVGGLKVEH